MSPGDRPADQDTVHATAIVIGRDAVLIRGASGSGKSALALRLLDRGGPGDFRALVGDDRIRLGRLGDRLIARPVETIEGLIEMRGLGILHEAITMPGVVGLAVDLVPVADAPRLPDEEAVELLGIRVPRLVLGADADATQKVERALCHLAHGRRIVLSQPETGRQP